MMARRWLRAMACIGALAAWTHAPIPAPHRYRVELKTSVVQDLTVVGQGEQKQEFSNIGFVTVSAKDSGPGQAVTLVLDSLVVGPGSPIQPEAAKAAAGTTWRGYREANGRVTEFKPDSANPVAGALEPAFRALFPPMKSGAREGQAWTDTTDTENDGIAVRTVTNYLTSRDSFSGSRVMKLAGAFSSALSGQRASPQGEVGIEGTGSGTTTWLVGSDGTCLSATYQSSQSISVTVAQVPEPIPVSVKTEGTATLLR
jgi:hypothetical protein